MAIVNIARISFKPSVQKEQLGYIQEIYTTLIKNSD